MQIEEYATETLEDISEYFLQLHSFLQNKEKQILEKFSEMCHQPQFQLRQACAKLNESQENLNMMKANLEFYQDKLPSDIHVSKILENYNQQLGQMPFEVHVTQPVANPFNFDIKMDIQEEIEKYFEYYYADPQLTVDLHTLTDDSNQSLMDTSGLHSSMDIGNATMAYKKPRRRQDQKQKPNFRKKQQMNQILNDDVDMLVSRSEASLSLSSHKHTPSSNEENLVRVTHVKTPSHFYVQKITDLQQIRELSSAYLDLEPDERVPKSISVGYYYMAYHVIDKQWYRGMLKKILPNGVYQMFLIDFGMHLQVTREKLCHIKEDSLKVPFAAIRCEISDIVPVGKQWTEEANHLLVELSQDKPAKMCVIEKINNEMLKIDLHTSITKSVRDSFLYTGLACERPGAQSFKMHVKKAPPISKTEDRIGKHFFEVGEVLMVNMLHIKGPHEFYVVKEDDIGEKQALVSEMNAHYRSKDTKHRQIYLASAQMCCAVCLDNIWYRAVIEEIKDGGTLLICLVDEGRREIINWRQAFALEEDFRTKREFAIRCTLADIEPLQENSYVYTTLAINDFKQMTTNPYLRMEIHSIKENVYAVILYVSKTNLEINVGAVLVKNKHAISTGETTQMNDILLLSQFRPIMPNAELSQNVKLNVKLKHSSVASSNNKTANEYVRETLKRSPVIVTHIVDPGEFYIQLTKFRKGTIEFHSKIQEAQSKKYPSSTYTIEPASRETRQWVVGNNCLVYTKYECSHIPSSLLRDCEWYRGVITSITKSPVSEPTFSVFLRDIGATIRSIAAHQLFTIDPQLNRVTNAVYRCHLASLKPTANMKTWPNSSKDYFSYTVEHFESLSVTLRGKRSPENQSLPVILWGSTTETSDPLAPCITKYTNIIRMLMEAGLAHKTEPLEVAQQYDEIEEMELKEGEISLQQWFKLFEDDLLLNSLEAKVQYPVTQFSSWNSTFSDIYDNVIDIDSSNYHPLNVYLNEVDITPTTGLDAAPPNWEVSKDIHKTLFTGYATYVDCGCVIFLHEADDKWFLEKMCKIVSETYESLPQPPMEYEYIKGQPCIAKYHLDSKFYRAIITKSIDENGEWGVRFVDYGNNEKVESKDIRPYAPFQNLPSLANKYVISGIEPNNKSGIYTVDQLDGMHNYIVGKFVSVRLPDCELGNTVKKCSMRLDNEDVASAFIKKGWAKKEHLSTRLIMIPDLDTNKTRNALPTPIFCTESENEYVVFDDNNNSAETCSPNWSMLSEKKIDQINNVIERLYKKTSVIASMNMIQSESQKQYQWISVTSPPKKRMFNHNDYNQMMNGDVILDDDDININNTFNNFFKNKVTKDNDEDVLQISQCFAKNYWHSAEDMTEGEEKANELQEKEDIESAFENFHPCDVSTVFSHFSGIEAFKVPHFSDGMLLFNCDVISVITTTVVQIFPITAEFEKRDIQMQRSIKRAAKIASPLTHFEPHTVCLACYSKDKKWYRAIIRSYNPIAKEVEVLYVDYLNSETLPQKCVRKCPEEIIRWPLRTLRVRLSGLKPNPKISDYKLRLALHKVLAKQTLLAVVKKIGSNINHADELFSFSGTTDIDLTEISLYKSHDLMVKNLAVYESLVDMNYFLRA